MKKRDGKKSLERRFAYDGLDRVIHERARLSLLTSLVSHGRDLSFGELKQFCALTDGNLNRHLQVLEEARLVSVTKGMDNNRPQTHCHITPLGRKRFVEYLAVLEQVLSDATGAADGSEHGATHKPSRA